MTRLTVELTRTEPAAHLIEPVDGNEPIDITSLNTGTNHVKFEAPGQNGTKPFELRYLDWQRLGKPDHILLSVEPA